jgi:hypothetical protein
MKRTKKRRWIKKRNTRKSFLNKKGGARAKVIPRVVHQIWFGSSVPSWRKYLFDRMRKICEDNGYKYNLWIETDRILDNFPITFAYQQDSITHGKNAGQNRFAQVADLARLEIINRYGGIYLDSLFIINDNFFSEIEKLNICDNKTFICCNEDPCGLNCVGGGNLKYLSNSFFAATKKNKILNRLLDTDILDLIDLENTNINRTTGPYYLRSGIKDEDLDTIGEIKTERIYPFPMSGSPYREDEPNICLSNVNKDDGSQLQVSGDKYLDINCFDKLSPDTLAVYLVGLGGTWST